MNPTTIQAGSAVELRFQVDVDGAAIPITEVRLSIKSGGTKFSYVASYKNSVATFAIVGLDRFVSPGGTYDYDIEVYIGSQYFVPFNGQIELVSPVSVKVQTVAVVEPKVTQIATEGLSLFPIRPIESPEKKALKKEQRAGKKSFVSRITEGALTELFDFTKSETRRQ